MKRKYQDRRLQAAYDGAIEAWRSGRRGWISPGRHGLWREDGSQFRGAGIHSAFWNGFNGLERRTGDGLMCVAGSAARSSYMAGRDCAREVRRLERLGLAPS